MEKEESELKSSLNNINSLEDLQNASYTKSKLSDINSKINEANHKLQMISFIIEKNKHNYHVLQEIKTKVDKIIADANKE